MGEAATILEDYGALALAAVRLAAVNASPEWLAHAQQLLDVIMEQFDDDAAASSTRPPTQSGCMPDRRIQPITRPHQASTAVHAYWLMAES